jgi:hypothetical protein
MFSKHLPLMNRGLPMNVKPNRKPVTKGELVAALDDLPDDATIYVSTGGGKVYKLSNVESHPTAGGEASAHLSGDWTAKEDAE